MSLHILHSSCANLHSLQQCRRVFYLHTLTSIYCLWIFFFFLMIAILTSLSWYILVVFTCISLLTSSVDHLFMGVLAFFLSSLKCLFQPSVLYLFIYFFDDDVGLHKLFGDTFSWAICRFWRACQLQHLQICSPTPSLWVVFLFIIYHLHTVQKLLSLIRSYLFIFVSITLGSGSKKILLWYMSKVFCIYFPLRVL